MSLGTKRFWPEHYSAELEESDGRIALILRTDGQAWSVLTIDVEEETIQTIWVIANPEKLRTNLTEAVSLLVLDMVLVNFYHLGWGEVRKGLRPFRTSPTVKHIAVTRNLSFQLSIFHLGATSRCTRTPGS